MAGKQLSSLDGWQLATPLGPHPSNDDRDWNCTNADADATLAIFARSQAVPVFWGHPQYDEAGNVVEQKEPVGWAEQLRKTAAGVEAFIRWNDEGRRLIDGDRARFFSPGARYAYQDAKGGFHFVGLDHLALVPRPAFVDLQVRRLAACRAAASTTPKGAPMTLTQEQVAAIIGAAGLDPSNVTPEQLSELVTTLEAAFGVPDADDPAEMPAAADPAAASAAPAPDAGTAAAADPPAEPAGTAAPTCPKCSTATPSGAAYCPGCGTRTKAPAPAASAKPADTEARLRALETRPAADALLAAARRDLRKVNVVVEGQVYELVAAGKADTAKALLASIEKGAPAGGRLTAGPGTAPSGGLKAGMFAGRNLRDPKVEAQVLVSAKAYAAEHKGMTVTAAVRTLCTPAPAASAAPAA
jgi:uncharacterized Zn finger protein (UPF0148 family)